MTLRRLYISTHGDRQRDPRPTSRHPSPRVRCAEDSVASRADCARDGARSALFRGQEPRFLDSAVDWLERLFLPEVAVGLRQLDGLDVSCPYAPPDSDGLLPDTADGVTVQAAHQDDAGVDADFIAPRRGCVFDDLLGHRDVERFDVPETQLPARRNRVPRRDPAQLLAARGMDGALLRDQLLPAAGKRDPAAREAGGPGVHGAARDAALPAQS